MPDSMFYDSSGLGIIIFFFIFLFFCKGDNHCLRQHKRDEFSCLIIATPMELGKPYTKTY